MGTDINTMIEVSLRDDEKYPEWVCAGSVDHLIHRNHLIFDVLGNIYNTYNVPYISHGRLSKEAVLTEEKIAFAKKLYEEYPDEYKSFQEALKDSYESALEHDYHLSRAFIDTLLAWDYNEWSCRVPSYVTLKEMMDYDCRSALSHLSLLHFEWYVDIFEIVWTELIDFLRKTGELYGQTNPKKIRLCFFFDS